jgi:hypothetical protein
VRRIAAVGLAATVILVIFVLGVAQLVLPGLAAGRLRAQLSRYGVVDHVDVHAFPAIELLWHRADHVSVKLSSYRSPAGQVASLIGESDDAGSLDASAAAVQVGLLRLRDAVLHKRGSVLMASGRVSEDDLRSAVPFLDGVVPVASAAGALTLQGTATVLGMTATVEATVGVQNGVLVVAPDLPFGGLATVGLFADPRIKVDGVAGAPASGGFLVSVHGHLN